MTQFVQSDAVIVTALAERDAVVADVADARVAADAGEDGDFVVVSGGFMKVATGRREHDASLLHPLLHRRIDGLLSLLRGRFLVDILFDNLTTYKSRTSVVHLS